jgi:5-methylcytosine-specific restriction endonuclease McrA
MKLTKFEELWSAVNNYELDRIAQTEIKIFNNIGLETDLSDIFQLDDGLVTVLKDGTVRKTIVYISEVKRWIIDEYNNYPKYHIFNCATLVQMKNQGRSYRYKKTLRSDGKFLMIISGEKNKSETNFIKLEICGNCLNKYNSKFARNYTKQTFNIKEYIKQPLSENSFSSLNYIRFENDLETVPSFYAKNWNQISSELKKMKNYTCQACGINLKKAKKYLHTHHIDGNPSNNDVISNLKVLCMECHSNEFNHGHIKNSPYYYEFLRYKERL